MKAKQYLTARKKHHVIYKTTCSVTGRYYIGMHSTDELEDGYLGSGKRLWQSIRKHGAETHTREILEHLPSREALRLREIELVNEELIGDPMCMNVALGGSSWDHVNASGANNYPKRGNPNVLAALIKARTAMWEKRKADPEYDRELRRKASEANKLLYANGMIPAFLGQKHTAETRAKNKAYFKEIGHQQGEKNSGFGSTWVSNLELKVSKRLSKGQEIEEGWVLGRNKWKVPTSKPLKEKVSRLKLDIHAVLKTYSELKSLRKTAEHFQVSHVTISKIVNNGDVA